MMKMNRSLLLSFGKAVMAMVRGDAAEPDIEAGAAAAATTSVSGRAGSAGQGGDGDLLVTGTLVNDVHGEEVKGCDEKNLTKRAYEYTKKAITFESVMLVALCNHESSYFSNDLQFKISMSLLLLAFFTDFVAAILLLINSCKFSTRYLIYISSLSQMLVPYFLLVSIDKHHAYIILAAFLLPSFIVLLYCACFGVGAAPDADTLDHIFDISTGVYTLCAGCALTSITFVSKITVSTGLLPSTLFLTIFLARYLMLITTVRPAVIVDHAGTLINLLKVFLSSTVVMAAVALLGMAISVVVISMGIIDAAMFSMAMLAHKSSRSPKMEEETSRHDTKDQRLLSSVMVLILFTVLTHSLENNVAVTLGSVAMARVLLYFTALLWSLNRMIIPLRVPEGQQQEEEEEEEEVSVIGAWWSSLEWMRASIVMLAVLDMIFKFATTLMMKGK